MWWHHPSDAITSFSRRYNYLDKSHTNAGKVFLIDMTRWLESPTEVHVHVCIGCALQTGQHWAGVHQQYDGINQRLDMDVNSSWSRNLNQANAVSPIFKDIAHPLNQPVKRLRKSIGDVFKLLAKLCSLFLALLGDVIKATRNFCNGPKQKFERRYSPPCWARLGTVWDRSWVIGRLLAWRSHLKQMSVLFHKSRFQAMKIENQIAWCFGTESQLIAAYQLKNRTAHTNIEDHTGISS